MVWRRAALFAATPGVAVWPRDALGFALWFVRNGGSPFHLQKILGHTSLDISRRYCELADIDAVTKQQELSPLSTMLLSIPGGTRMR